MESIKILSIFGTRPEAIKMAPLVKELEKTPGIASRVCVTAQHREMLDQVLDIFAIQPAYDLDIMQEKQSIGMIVSNSLGALIQIISGWDPDLVLVHGDTSTTFTGALASFYCKKAVGHVEAGLRTYNKYAPFPEEMNRVLTSDLATLHFAPTRSNRLNLQKENITEDVYVTGNTVIDAMKYTVKTDYEFKDQLLKEINFSAGKWMLLTAHRRENIGKPLENICKAAKRLVAEHDDLKLVFPVHLNPLVRETVYSILGRMEKVNLIEPLDVQDMHNLMQRSDLILTDSGGLQEEAPSLGKPVLVLRGETERPEAVKAGTVKLVGTDELAVYETAATLLTDAAAYDRMAKAVNPYGDGLASERIVQAIFHYFGRGGRPADFQP